jgi:predicted dehydrogenase
MTISVGIIGQGRSGRNIHGAHLCADPRFRIVAVADTVEARCRRAVEEYGCEAHSDYRQLLARRDLDLVVETSCTHTRPGIVVEALEAGHPVLCEKPMAATLGDADRMIAASEHTGRMLAVFHQSRFSPSFRKVVELIRSGVLGRIVQISISHNAYRRRWDWQTLRSHGGGSLMNTGAHLLDQIVCLFGDALPDVRCFMDRVNTAGDAEDYVKLVLSGPGQPVVDIEISSCCAYPSFTYNVQGTLGGLKGSMTDLEWKYIAPREAPPLEPVTDPLSGPDGTPSYCAETLPWHEGRWSFNPAVDGSPNAAYRRPPATPSKPRPQASSPYYAAMAAAYYDMLYVALTTGAPLAITPQQVRRQMALFELCRRQNPQIYGSQGETRRPVGQRADAVPAECTL